MVYLVDGERAVGSEAAARLVGCSTQMFQRLPWKHIEGGVRLFGHDVECAGRKTEYWLDGGPADTEACVEALGYANLSGMVGALNRGGGVAERNGHTVERMEW